MQLIVYSIAYPFLWIISKLPWRLFYTLSTFIYLLVYYIVRYRRKTVRENLTLVFPEKTNQEIQKIEKQFYKHMCDMFLEMIKTLSISEEELVKRFKIIDPHTVQEFEKRGRSIMVLFGHYASYEWSIAAYFTLNLPIAGVYKKIKNKYFDRLVHRMRNRFDAKLITSSRAMKEITKDIEKGRVCAYGLVSDQSPKIYNATYWTDFMGIKVPAFMGGEVLAKRLEMPVMFLKVEKVKRGYYQAKFVPITEDASKCGDYFVVKTYLKMLEEQIKEQPQYYLWTHKRWKHRNTKPPKGATID